MNYLIFMLVIAMCSGLNEGCVWCNKNTLEVQNQLTPGSILKVNCSSNRKHVEGLRELKFNEKYNIAVSELGIGRRIVWRCTLRHGDKVKSSQTIWRAYRGASQARSGEKRSWIARVDGIYLEKNGKAKGLEHHWISVVSPDLFTSFSPLRLYHTMPSQASTVLHKAGFVAFPISSSLERLCKSVDSPDLLTTSPLPPSHYAVSSIDGSSQSHGVVARRPIAISNQIGLQTFNVAYDSRASHLKFLPFNIPTSSYRYINVVFDYHSFQQTAMGSKVNFFLPSSMSPRFLIHLKRKITEKNDDENVATNVENQVERTYAVARNSETNSMTKMTS
ncbi:hypothetical protein IGI04_005352 [Brassica rapa subsp. trilocularis]|uniref:S-protein homolog n=1 Tax=Brassica rapa subsp. trilocularis TaxID=1813537 RepID=A0ABQ7NEC1_BRACM|nr:hypothetical protein IGI04_005352 [Brassica rapa subsp. trilocularis]